MRGETASMRRTSRSLKRRQSLRKAALSGGETEIQAAQDVEFACAQVLPVAGESGPVDGVSRDGSGQALLETWINLGGRGQGGTLTVGVKTKSLHFWKQ